MKTHKTKLKKVQSKEKHALRIIFNQSKTAPSEPLFLNLNVLNVYQINIFQSVQFMHKIKNKSVPHIFVKLFGVPQWASTLGCQINVPPPRLLISTFFPHPLRTLLGPPRLLIFKVFIVLEFKIAKPSTFKKQFILSFFF